MRKINLIIKSDTDLVCRVREMRIFGHVYMRMRRCVCCTPIYDSSHRYHSVTSITEATEADAAKG